MRGHRSRYVVRFSPRYAGTLFIQPKVNGVAIGAKLQFAIAPGELHGPACNVSGLASAIVAGVPTSFSITAKDRFGNERTGGGDAALFFVELGGSAFEEALIVAPHIQPLREDRARYVCHLTAKKAGTLFLQLFVQRSPVIEKRPIVVMPAPIYAPNCAITGAPVRAVAGLEEVFVVHSVDKFGNERAQGMALDQPP
jgi:hypothetical protein